MNAQKSLLCAFSLLFSAGAVVAMEGTQSTSDGGVQAQISKTSPLNAPALFSSLITFSEFPVGTSIANQYQPQGILFGGDSPFITTDSSNPTSPVLSGTPLFFGSITGTFVDPATGSPVVVTSFSLDAGFFDGLGTFDLSWFNKDGVLLGSESNTEIGIQTFTVTGVGIASFHVSGGSDAAGFAIDNIAFDPGSLATVKINSADLVENKIQVVIEGPAQATGSLSLAIKGANNTFTAKYNNGTAVGPGSYTVNLVRPMMAQDVYSIIEATWNASTPPVTSTFTINPAWNVRGIVQNTVYIKVYETACSGTPTPGYWTFNDRKSCVFTATNFKPMFASQTFINGSGLTASGLLIHANVENYCSKHYPVGANSRNTFYTISDITGSCRNSMADTNVAVYPNPVVNGGTYSCNDQLLYVATDTNANVDSLRDVEDYCPACKRHVSGTSDHIDNYYDKNSCTANSLPNYWAADIGSVGQQIQVPVAGVVGMTESAGQQAFYRDSDIIVKSKKVNDSLMLSIKSKDRHSDVKLPPEVFDVQKIERYQGWIIVIGDIGASISQVTIIDAGTGKVTDSFVAFYPAVSPDGRFIAFTKFYSPHGAIGTEDHLMLYDMTKSAIANRPIGVPGPAGGLGSWDNRIDVGLNVYPGNDSKEDDNVGWLSHQAASLIFWSPDSTKLVFADQTQEVLSLVLMKVAGADAGAVPSALTMIIDGTRVCAAPLPENPCQAYLDQVKFGENGLRAFFSGVGTQGSIHRELNVSYEDFMPSK